MSVDTAQDLTTGKRKREASGPNVIDLTGCVVSSQQLESLFNDIHCNRQESWQQMQRFAIDENQPLAQAAVAIIYHDGVEYCRFVKKEPEQANLFARLCWKQLRQESSKGVLLAMCFVGLILSRGIGTPADDVEGRRLLCKAANKGCCTAQSYWGLMLAADDRRSALATQFLRLAAAQGNAIAQCSFGLRLRKGYGANVNPAEAARIFDLAAKQGHISATYWSGLYQSYAGIRQNLDQALKNFQAAAVAGQIAAQTELAKLYYNGIGVTKSHSEAFRWYQSAAAANNCCALYGLGLCYYHGNGVPKDGSKAANIFQKLVSMGQSNPDESNALVMLGVCYLHGTGLARNHTMAIELHRKAAAKGNATAKYNIGSFYQNGTGVAIDAVEAVAWYLAAMEHGFINAFETLGWCYQRGFGVPKNLSEAIRLYQLSVQKGSEHGQARLAHCYAHGIGVIKDLVEALRLYSLAAAKSHALSSEIVAAFDALISRKDPLQKS
jgi:TPR repeat protein